MADDSYDKPEAKDRAAIGGGRSTKIPPTMIGRLIAGYKYIVRGDDSWFGPGEPIQAIAPKDVAGRQFDFPFAYNVNGSPRSEEAIGFDTLRALADNYDVLRIVIEARKDQIAKINWKIKPKDAKAKPDERCDVITAFFMSPDKIHTWDEWLRMLVEDMLVIDAATLYPRLTNGGQLYSLEPMDGATININLDGSGRRPIPPETAFTQNLKGMTAVHYTADEIIYKPRNPRTHKAYGYSQVEQIIMTVHIALRRQLTQFDYFESGTLPDAISGAPVGWTAKQIQEWQEYFDNLLVGDPTKKRKVRYMPKEMADSFKEVKAPILKDLFDEWLARVVCYCFSIAPQPFVSQVNRATAETDQERAVEEGLVPMMRWVKSLMDQVIAKYFGFTDIEFTWDEEEDTDPLQQAEIDKIYIDCGVTDANEIRKRLGYEARKVEEPMDPSAPVDPNAPAPITGAPGAAGGAGVQATALNGTQVTALQGIVQAVIDKQMPSDTARAMMQAAFPGVDQALIDNMLNAAKDFEAAPPEPMPGMPGALDDNGDPIPADDGAVAEEDPKAVAAKKRMKIAEDFMKNHTAGIPGAWPTVNVTVNLPEITPVVDIGATSITIQHDDNVQKAVIARSGDVNDSAD